LRIPRLQGECGTGAPGRQGPTRPDIGGECYGAQDVQVQDNSLSGTFDRGAEPRQRRTQIVIRDLRQVCGKLRRGCGVWL
jgi:hypothetical protein